MDTAVHEKGGPCGRDSGSPMVMQTIDRRFFRSRYNSDQLLNRFAYRVMFRLIGPRKVFTSVGRRWATFHRGTEVSAGQLSARGGVLRWKVPPRSKRPRANR